MTSIRTAIPPNMRIKILEKKPTNRETNRSMNPDIPRAELLAEIWRNGLNNVPTSWLKEKKSAESFNFCLKLLAKKDQPREYHHCTKSTMNIFLLYHMRYNVIMKSRVKNKSDPRYICVQDRFNKIIEQLIRKGRLMKTRAKGISRKANVNPSTFYDHYRGMDDALKYVCIRMEKELRKIKKEVGDSCDLGIVYLKIFYFIWKNKDYYGTMIHYKMDLPLVRIMEIFRPIICRKWRHYSQTHIEQSFRILCGEFCGIISYWGQKEKFDDGRISHYVKKMTLLSQDTCGRLQNIQKI